MTFGKRMRKRREFLDLTQEELAKMLDVTSQHISAIEQDKRVPSLDFLAKLAEGLGVSFDFLITGKEGKEGEVVGIIPAIKADKRLNAKTKKILISIVEAFYEANFPK